ncbi:hypothetical protein NU195Hw_g6849t1 [Hortaea werneckii]
MNDEPRANRPLMESLRSIWRWFKPNFYRCHLAYFVVTILITSFVFHASNTSREHGNGGQKIRYVDSLFLTASAMTATGLNTVDLNVPTTYQQSILFVLMILGDLSTISASVVFVRRYLFRKRIGDQVATSRHAQKLVANIDEELAARQTHESRRHRTPGNFPAPDQSAEEPPSPRPRWMTPSRRICGLVAPWKTSLWRKITSALSAWTANAGRRPEEHHYLSFRPKLDSRGRFRQLNEAEYAELGGVEYRALQLLCWLLPLHTAFWIVLLMVILVPYASIYRPVAEVLRDSQAGNLSPAWWAVFIAVSSYTNCGLTPLVASMIPFQSNWLILIVTGAGVIAGNTFYPIFLRCYLWILSKVVPKEAEFHHSIAFLLHHPRRCYLWLFDGRTTWVLAATQLGLIATEWLLFEILNINQTAVDAWPLGTRIMDGLYQCLGTRSSGLYVLTISSLAPAMKVIYMVVMYFSVYPLLISLRTTNIYEERSVGLDAEQLEADDAAQNKKKRQDPKKGRLRGLHIRNQLAYDLWWIALAWILICIVEEPRLNSDAPGFTIFAIMFETVSAYGNVGLSLGVPGKTTSLCGDFHTLSKLILIPVMLRGRHRILPLAIDRSIILPGQSLLAELDHHYIDGLQDERSVERRIREAERGAQAESSDVSQPCQDPDT